MTETYEFEELTYSKQKLLTFSKYANRVDLLNTLLQDGQYYTLAEVDKIIKEFMGEGS